MTAPVVAPPVPSSWHMLRALGGVGTLCGLLIAVVFQGTLPTIERNKAIALEKAVLKVLPGAVAQRPLEAADLPSGLYAGYAADGHLVGVAIEAAGQGFQDQIRLLYGYDPVAQRVVGMEVLESRETPGLGDKIMLDADFIANFTALDVRLDDASTGLLHPVEAVKKGAKEHPWQVDGITGATISAVAVADIIGTSAARALPAITAHLRTEEKGDRDG